MMVRNEEFPIMKNSLRNLRWWDLPAALLLLAAILTAGTRLVATLWTTNLSIVQTLVFFGIFAGLALGYSRFSARLAGFFALVYGLFCIPWQLGLTLSAKFEWTERLNVLSNRLQIILAQLIDKEPVRDSLLFLVVMFALFWVLSVLAGYALTRHGDAWQAILPAGLAMFVIHSFDPVNSGRIWYLAIYLFFSLILVARLTFLHHNDRWKESRTALPPHISLDFIRYTILAAFLIVIFAWTAPALANALPQARKAWQPVRTAWYNAINHFENAFASLRSSVFVYTGVYGDTAVLGRGAVLSDTRIFQVTVPSDLPDGVRLYWRARTYETYTNGEWESQLYTSYVFDPQAENLPAWLGTDRWPGRFKIMSAVPITTLFTPTQPVWVSRTGKVQYAANPDNTIDISGFEAAPSVGPGETYEILASIANPSIEQMTQAGTSYPDWVKQRYLQLPRTITPRTRQLAEQITAGMATPYDKVVAITNYLRRNIQYVETLADEPPTNQELIDWFLFDEKKGFCNYYSTAEIVMLRSLGIPARWAVGYAQGEPLENAPTNDSSQSLTYLVRQRNSHAWPEVFFPEIGWVEFEPTATQPDIQRPATTQDQGNAALTAAEEAALLRQEKQDQLRLMREQGNQNLPAPSTATPKKNPLWLAALVAGVIMLVLGLRFMPYVGLPAASILLQALFIRAGLHPPSLVESWAERAELAPKPKPIQLTAVPILLERILLKLRLKPPKALTRWARHSELPPLSKAYMEINRSLNLFGKPADMTETPAERAASLGRIIPPTETPARALVAEYQLGAFSQQPADLSLAQKSASEIRRLSFNAYLKRLLERFQKPDQSRRLNPLDLSKRQRS
jgi:transglutaminase-like putative cysteine protease